MSKKVGTILFIGYGNPARLDDGLGPTLADQIEKLKIPDVTVDSNYQLTVEDSTTVAEHDVVIFADASVNCVEPFSFKEIFPQKKSNFTTHVLEPEVLLGLAHELFNAQTRGFILSIRGYAFNEFGQKFSDLAQNNLLDAFNFIQPLLRSKNFDV